MTAVKKINDEARLHRETEAAKELLRNISNVIGDDDEAKADAVEGETNLFEAIEAAVSCLDECDILLSGIKQKQNELSSRQAATIARADRIRSSIEQALMVLDRGEPLRLPTMTLSLRKVPQSLVITDEAAIPSDYWKQKPAPAPTLDKKALIADLKEKKQIKGVELDNGGQTLAIRRA
jgi:hypothetical protein